MACDLEGDKAVFCSNAQRARGGVGEAVTVAHAREENVATALRGVSSPSEAHAVRDRPK